MRRAARLVESDYLSQYAARSYAISAKGTQEQINQDSYLAADHFPATGRHLPASRKHMPSIHDPGDALYVIADGEGDAHAGSRASGRAVETIEESLRQAWTNLDQPARLAPDRQVLNLLRVAFDRADHAIKAAKLSGLVCDVGLAAMAVHGSKLYLAHVGDDPTTYLWRAGILHHLNTSSNSAAFSSHVERPFTEAFAVHEKNFGESAGAGSPLKLRVVELEPNDYVLLCSKGLVRHVRDHIIRSTISATPDPQKICDSLFAEAGKYPIPEDLTMIAVRFALTHE